MKYCVSEAVRMYKLHSAHDSKSVKFDTVQLPGVMMEMHGTGSGVGIRTPPMEKGIADGTIKVQRSA